MPGTCCEHNGLALQGFPEKAMNKLEDFGFIQSRPKGEYHANNQQMSKLLHKAIGLGNKGAAPQVSAQAHHFSMPLLCLSSAIQYHSFPSHPACRPCRHVGKQFLRNDLFANGLCAKYNLMQKPQCSRYKGTMLVHACHWQMC